MDSDTELLQRNALIDYSVFLLQVDRNKMIHDKVAKERPILYYDKDTGLFRVTMKKVAPANVTPDLADGQSEFDKQNSSLTSNDPGVMKPSTKTDTDKLMEKSSSGVE